MAKKIFVVEDDEAIRDAIVELLESEDYAVEHAANGRVALNQILATAALPDLILLDLMMPVMDGFAFCEAKRKRPNLAAIPTIVMSADGNVKRKQTQTGATAYMKKPIDIDALIAQIAACLAG